MYTESIKRFVSIFIIAFVLWIIYTIANATNIVKTEYEFSTNKISQNYKILFISDTHYSGGQNKGVVKKILPKLNAVNADIVIFGGDIVESRTSYDEMLEITKMFGSLSNKYGIYYVYGNHDRQDYKNTRTYSDEDLAIALKENNINILFDDYVLINNDLSITGRDDITNPDYMRINVGDIIATADVSNRYNIVVDHQPIEYWFNAAYGMDLQLSGHTHAGQLFPINIYFTWNKFPRYGCYRYGNMNMIISSGQGVGAFACRNLQHCEYVVITISKEDKE